MRSPLLISSLLAASLIVLFSVLNRDFQLDDALIYHRYVRNALEGHGLVYNDGERFNALTSPLHTFLLLALAFPLQDVQLASTILSSVFMILAALIWIRLVARNASPMAGRLGGILFAGSMFFYSTFGLETTLFITLLGLCILLFQNERTFFLGLAMALLVMTRGEAVLLLPALAIEHFRQKRPLPRPINFVLPTAIILTFLIFNRLYFGDFLPHTLAAKINQGKAWADDGGPIFLRVGYLFPHYVVGHPAWGIAALGSAIVGAIGLRFSPLNVILGSFLLFYTAFYVGLGLPNYHWYNAPYLITLFFYAGIGMDKMNSTIATHMSGVPALASRGVLYASVAAILLASTAHAWRTIPEQTVHHEYRDIGIWLRDNTESNAQVAAFEIGTIGYYSRRPIVDILGLTNPHNAEYVAERKLGMWLRHYSPDYIIAHEPLFPWERYITRLKKSDQARVRKRFDQYTVYETVGLDAWTISTPETLSTPEE